MADIDVVPKRKTSIWIWLLVALAVIAILWVVFGSRATSRQTFYGAPIQPAVASTIAPGLLLTGAV